jgi:hypothetical protein
VPVAGGALILKIKITMGRNERLVVLTSLILAFSFLSREGKWVNAIPRQDDVRKGFLYDILKERESFKIFLNATGRAGFIDLPTGEGLPTFFVLTDVSFKRYSCRQAIINTPLTPNYKENSTEKEGNRGVMRPKTRLYITK